MPTTNAQIARIGLFGGSFDPIHRAHLSLASAALQYANLDQVQFIPAGQPWQRSKLKASPTHRATMVELAIADEPRFCMNAIEIEREGETYTIDTLLALPQGPDYFWLMGADQLENFCSWSDWEAIAKLVSFLVACRPHHDLTVPAPLQALIDQGITQVKSLPFDAMPTSATQIRETLARGQSVGQDLSPAVAEYINKHHLYQNTV
ncbi:MAG: nicotinate-nucleotide adenylyltransferase [Orrella sp.]